MTPPIHLTVNNQPLHGDPQQSLLANLLAADIHIPHLCHHPGLPPQGRCSLCLVEIQEGKEWRTEHACLAKLHDGMVIRTESDQLTRARSLAAALLQRRGPFRNPSTNRVLAAVTSKTNALDQSLKTKQTGCILCGLCISMCQKIDRNRLTFLGRGPALAVGYVSEQESCGSCRACASVCPTGYIEQNGATAFRPTLYRKKNGIEST